MLHYFLVFILTLLIVNIFSCVNQLMFEESLSKRSSSKLNFKKTNSDSLCRYSGYKCLTAKDYIKS